MISGGRNSGILQGGVGSFCVFDNQLVNQHCGEVYLSITQAGVGNEVSHEQYAPIGANCTQSEGKKRNWHRDSRDRDRD
jgi:hypothetical protein